MWNTGLPRKRPISTPKSADEDVCFGLYNPKIYIESLSFYDGLRLLYLGTVEMARV